MAMRVFLRWSTSVQSVFANPLNSVVQTVFTICITLTQPARNTHTPRDPCSHAEKEAKWSMRFITYNKFGSCHLSLLVSKWFNLTRNIIIKIGVGRKFCEECVLCLCVLECWSLCVHTPAWERAICRLPRLANVWISHDKFVYICFNFDVSSVTGHFDISHHISFD